MDDHNILVDMLFDREPLENFQKLFTENYADYDWEHLLHLCYWEERYESVGGDEGYLDNPFINTERLSFLRSLIEFLEKNGIKAEKF